MNYLSKSSPKWSSIPSKDTERNVLRAIRVVIRGNDGSMTDIDTRVASCPRGHVP